MPNRNSARRVLWALARVAGTYATCGLVLSRHTVERLVLNSPADFALAVLARLDRWIYDFNSTIAIVILATICMSMASAIEASSIRRGVDGGRTFFVLLGGFCLVLQTLVLAWELVDFLPRWAALAIATIASGCLLDAARCLARALDVRFELQDSEEVKFFIGVEAGVLAVVALVAMRVGYVAGFSVDFF